jgi:hypothetical protein
MISAGKTPDVLALHFFLLFKAALILPVSVGLPGVVIGRRAWKQAARCVSACVLQWSHARHKGL